MIREKDISEFMPQVRYQGGQSINLQTVQGVLSDCAGRYGIPVAFKDDQIKFGGLIGGYTRDCIVLFHPEHERDYFNFMITISHQGGYAFASVYCGGTSKLMKKEEAASAAKAELKQAGRTTLHSWFGGGSNSGAVEDVFRSTVGFAKTTGSLAKAAIGGLRSLGGGKEKLQEEKNWYAMIYDIFNEMRA